MSDPIVQAVVDDFVQELLDAVNPPPAICCGIHQHNDARSSRAGLGDLGGGVLGNREKIAFRSVSNTPSDVPYFSSYSAIFKSSRIHATTGSKMGSKSAGLSRAPLTPPRGKTIARRGQRELLA